MFLPAAIHIGSIKINNTDHSGAVSFGSNLKWNRNVSAKKNQGFGQQHADCVVRFATVQMVLDDEWSDAFSMRTKKVSSIGREDDHV